MTTYEGTDAGEEIDSLTLATSVDRILGLAGDDTLIARRAGTTLVGGVGSDLFVLDNDDAIVLEDFGEADGFFLWTYPFDYAATDAMIGADGDLTLSFTGYCQFARCYDRVQQDVTLSAAHTVFVRTDEEVQEFLGDAYRPAAAPTDPITDERDLLGVEQPSWQGAAGNDTVFGNAATNELSGGAGFDVLRGMGGADLLIGGGDRDQLFGGDGDDTMFGYGDDMTGGEGRDDFWVGDDSTVTDLAVGDALVAPGSGFGVIPAVSAIEDTYAGVRLYLTRSAGSRADTSDTIAVTLQGMADDPLAFAVQTDDAPTFGTLRVTVFTDETAATTVDLAVLARGMATGGAGNDTLFGGALDDVLMGGAGDDVIYGDGGPGAA